MGNVQAQTEKKSRPTFWKVWVKTARPFSLTAAVSPVLVGTAVAAYEGTFHLAAFLVTLLSCLFLQIAANYFNEYFDYRYGLDHSESLGASTVIFRHEMTATQVLAGGIGCFVIAAVWVCLHAGRHRSPSEGRARPVHSESFCRRWNARRIKPVPDFRPAAEQ